MNSNVLNILTAAGINPDEYAASQHGVKGMKWGIRKKRTSGSSSSSKPEKSSPKKSSPPVQAKRPNTFREKPNNRRMTDAELRSKLNRLQMEKQYRDLTADTPKAKSFMKQLMAESGKQAAKQVANKAVNVGVQMAIEAAAKNAKGPSKTFLTAMAEQGQKKKKKD